MKKITLLLIAVFVLSAANLYAQQRVSRDVLGQLLHQMYFDYVPENEFNQVFQNFMKTNYPGQNIFYPNDVREITSSFMFSFMDNEAVMDKWTKYAKAREAEQQAKKDEAARQETARQEVARQEAIRQEAARQEAAWQEVLRKKNTNTLSIKDKNAAIDYYNSGVDYFNKRDYDSAIVKFTESIRINPYEADVYECRGSAYLFKGNFAQARADANKALQLDPNYKAAKDLDAEIKRLEQSRTAQEPSPPRGKIKKFLIVEMPEPANAAKPQNAEYTDTKVSIPYKIEGGAAWNWQIFSPSIPNDVPQDIYNRLWNINQKTIKAGKYDFNAFNYNTAQSIVYDESALSDNYTFSGVCMNYADYFIFVLKHDSVLLELYNKGIITENTSSTHKWIEYRTEKNRYIIDPTWCDWDYVGQPYGIYANNAEFAEACRTSYNRNNLIEAKSKSWFFRNVKTVTEEFDRRSHGM